MQSDTSFEVKEVYAFDDLVEIMRLLRAPDGCPWDREQTHTSIRKNLIEEAYEVVEGIDSGDPALLCEELGDLLLQIVFHAQMSSEDGQFDIGAVCDGICKKLIRRHPHIFGDVTVSGSSQVLDNWDAIKRDEKGQATVAQTMEHIFRGMPALMRAQKVQHKAAKVGFDWPDASGAYSKLDEEGGELREALESGDRDAVADEAGDLLFAAVNVVRLSGVDAEEALTRASDKFISRFTKVERMAAQAGEDMKELGLERLDRYWDAAKEK